MFTSGGHYIVLVADTDGTIIVHDPYLYNGKFNTASRRVANAIVSGNSVYVTEDAFNTYANYKNFWIFSNDCDPKNENEVISTINYTRYVATQSSNLNVRDNPNGNKISSLSKGKQVNVIEVSGDWNKINSPIVGWVSTQYLSASIVKTSSTINTNKKIISGYKTGTYKVNTNIHVRSGPGINYYAKTHKQLTSNARAQNRKYGNYYYNGYKKRSNMYYNTN